MELRMSELAMFDEQKSTESTCSSARQQHGATLQVQRLVQRALQTGHGEYIGQQLCQIYSFS